MANKTTYELALEIGGKIQSSLEKSVGGANKKLDSIGKAAKTALASVAVLVVFFPISRAAASSFAYSSLVAPAVAAVFELIQ